MNVIRKMKLLRLVLGTWERLERVQRMRIKTKTNVWLQSLAVLVHSLQQAQGLVPEEYAIYLHTAVGVLQLAVGLVAHRSNPDATPVAVAYVKPGKKGY